MKKRAPLYFNHKTAPQFIGPMNIKYWIREIPIGKHSVNPLLYLCWTAWLFLSASTSVLAQCPYDVTLSGGDSTCINNSSVSGLLSYTPTANFNTFYDVYDLTYINDGDLDVGTIWGPSTPDPYELTMTFNTAVILDSVRLRAGQFNGNYNKPTTMKLYLGTSSGTLLKTITPTYTLDNNTISGNEASTIYTWVITPAAAYVGLREIECYGATNGYSVTDNSPSTYTWTITGGTQASGGNTNGITVDWGSTGMVGKVEVLESCGPGIVEINVNIHPVPPSSITGATSVLENTNGEAYSVSNATGYTYTWTITGGTQASGGTSNSITVDWGSAGAGNVRVVANMSCGSSTPLDLPVTIFGSVKSITTGNWNSTSTWDCSCVPTALDNIIIDNADIVTLVANTICNRLDIYATGTLNDGGFDMTVTGELIVNGTYSGTGNLILSGSGSNIDGSGSISNTGEVRITIGNKTIPASANLAITGGDLNIADNNITVTNNGTISITGGNGIIGNNSTRIWVNASNSTLKVAGGIFDGQSGILTASASGNLVEYDGAGAQNIKIPSSGYYNLTSSGSGIKSLSGNITVTNDLTISSTLDASASNFNINLGGDWINSGTFNERAGTVEIGGSGAQQISNSASETFASLTINKTSSTLTINDNVIVSSTLTMTSGDINIGANKVTLGTSTVSTGTLTHTSGIVTGIFERWIGTTGIDYIFPVGITGNYWPLIARFSNLSSGSMLAEFNTTDPGSNGLPLTDDGMTVYSTFSEGYWDLTAANSLSSSDFDMNMAGTGFTSHVIGGATRLLSRANSSSPWLANGVHVNAVGDTAKRSTLSSFPAHYCFGDTVTCTLPVTSAITGADSVCTGSSPLVLRTYTPTSSFNTFYSTYDLTYINDGDLDAGPIWGPSTPNPYELAMNFSSAVLIDSVRLRGGQYNGNFNIPSEMKLYRGSSSGTLLATITPTYTIAAYTFANTGTDILYTWVITPSASYCAIREIEAYGPPTYSVVQNAGSTYTWLITGGTQSGGGNNNVITIDWGSTGMVGKVEAVESNSCGAGDTATFNVNIHTISPASISGNTNVAANATGEAYSVVATSGYTYTWVIVGGSQVSGGTTDAITVDWGAGGTAKVKVVASSSCGTADTVFLDVTITDAITSNGTGGGNWDATSTWAGAVIPSPGDSVTILGGDSVIVNADSSCIYLSLTMPTGSNNTVVNVLTGVTFTVNGEIDVNGDGSSANTIIRLSGTAVMNVTSNINLTATTASTALIDLSDGASTLNLGGNVVQNTAGTFSGGSSSTVNLNGSASQTLNLGTDIAYNNLIFNNSSGVTLGSAITTSNVTGNVTISSGSSLNSGGFDMALAGNWSNSGTFTAGSNTVVMEGSSAQTISGSSVTNFKHLTINNSNGVSITSPQYLTGTLTLSSGTLTTGGNLTLISNSSGTARIGEITGGAISGNITAQRYVTPGSNSWRFLSSPVSGQTLANWGDDFGTTGFPGSTDPGFSFVSIYTYNETVFGISDNGYTVPSDISDPIIVGKGYWCYLGPTPLTFAVTGPANTGPISLPITYTDDPGQPASEDGWNMVGNPFASSIDWDAAGWTKTNIGSTFYIYKEGGTYATYPEGGPGTNGGTKDIAASQGFWIQTTASSPSPVLTATESVKSTTDVSFLKVQNQVYEFLRLNVSANSINDEAIIRLVPGASEDMDSFDAYKLSNPNPLAPNISTVVDNTDLVINSLPDTIMSFSIPVKVLFDATGTYTINIENFLNSLPTGACLILEDLLTGDITDLKTDSSYTFSVPVLTSIPRFMIHLVPPITLNGIDLSCSGSANGYAVALGQGAGPWDYIWTDSNNDTLQVTNNLLTEDTLENLNGGTYSVYINQPNALCGGAEENVIIIEPAPVSTNVIKNDAGCYGDNNGSIDLNISGGISPYTFLWSTGAATENLSNLSSGTYSITITDLNGCTKNEAIIITQPDSIAIVHTEIDASCFGEGDASIDLSVSGGAPPYNYLWSNGLTAENLINLQPGNYSVTITDGDSCTNYIPLITVKDGLILVAGFAASATGIPAEVQFTNISTGGSSYYWNFGDGETSIDENPAHMYGGQGNYPVVFTIYNGPCSDIASDVVIVAEDPLSIENLATEKLNIHIYTEGQGAIISFGLSELTTVRIDIFNVLGQEVISIGSFEIRDGIRSIDLSDIQRGMYLVRISLSKERTVTLKLNR